jgi:hypothetical protein
MVIVNFSGGLIILVAVGVAAIAEWLTSTNWRTDPGLGMLVGGSVVLAVDLIYRGKGFPGEDNWRFVKPSTGGHIIFLPVWLFGLSLCLVGAEGLLTARATRPADIDQFMRETVSLLEKTVRELEKMGTRAEWEAAQDQVNRCQQRLREVGELYRGLSDQELGRLERRYGSRITQAAEGLQVQTERLSQLAD